MKRIQLTLFAIALALAFTGCDTTKAVWNASTKGVNLSASGDPGIVHDDAIIVNTEKLLNISLDTFDTFLKIERDNEAGLKKVSPKIHDFAENVRRNGKGWIKSAQKAKNVYRDNRTSQNHANLVTAYKTLQAAITEAQKYINNHGGV